jgi:antitoxin (DNA-binding transcriptional repressor) of toxin-antitoxin stability system
VPAEHVHDGPAVIVAQRGEPGVQVTVYRRKKEKCTIKETAAIWTKVKRKKKIE